MPAIGHPAGWVTFRAVVGIDTFLQRADLESGTVATWQAAPATYGGPVGVTRGAASVFAQGPLNGPAALWVWPVDRPAVLLDAPPVAGFVLR